MSDGGEPLPSEGTSSPSGCFSFCSHTKRSSKSCRCTLDWTDTMGGKQTLTVSLAVGETSGFCMDAAVRACLNSSQSPFPVTSKVRRGQVRWAALTIGGRLMVLIVGVGLVVGVDVLFIQWGGRWRRRGVRSLHPWREEWTRHPGGDGQRWTLKPERHSQHSFCPNLNPNK